jgi:DNA-binding ferritin-like protein
MDPIASLILTLFHAGTAAHVLHLQAVGPGSFARHSALNDFYHDVIDAADEIAECWQGKYGIITPYAEGYANPGQNGTPSDALDFLKSLNAFVAETRKDVVQDSEIQNLIDEVVALIDRTIYKVERLQ